MLMLDTGAEQLQTHRQSAGAGCRVVCASLLVASTRWHAPPAPYGNVRQVQQSGRSWLGRWHHWLLLFFLFLSKQSSRHLEISLMQRLFCLRRL